MDDAAWRHFLNDEYKGPELPLDGSGAPDLEITKRGAIKDGESPVVLQKIITEMYVYTSNDIKDLWYGADTIQNVHILGTMRLSDAKKIIDTAKKKRRRK